MKVTILKVGTCYCYLIRHILLPNLSFSILFYDCETTSVYMYAYMDLS